jgi:hypothetical protein
VRESAPIQAILNPFSMPPAHHVGSTWAIYAFAARRRVVDKFGK